MPKVRDSGRNLDWDVTRFGVAIPPPPAGHRLVLLVCLLAVAGAGGFVLWLELHPIEPELFGSHISSPAWERPARLAVTVTLAAAPIVLLAFFFLLPRDRYYIEFDPVSLMHTRVGPLRTRRIRWRAGDIADVLPVSMYIRFAT